MQWNEKIDLTKADSEFSDIFIYFPDNQFLEFLEQDKAYQTEDIFGRKLYKLSKKAD